MTASERIPDLVGRTEIAERLGVSIKTVDSWRSRPPVVPMPDEALTISGTPVWLWSEIERWAAATGRASRAVTQ